MHQVHRTLPSLEVCVIPSEFRALTDLNVAGITDDNFIWIPPEGTEGLFEQAIEAQDSEKNAALTDEFTVAAKAESRTSSVQKVQYSLSSI